jgi:ribonuclease HI
VSRSTLYIYTDASIKGRFWPRFQRYKLTIEPTRNGPSMGAWIGWHDCEVTERPDVAGMAYLGEHGTQSAEYMALIHGLHAVIAYQNATRKRRQLDAVVIGTDNATVANQLNRRWDVKKMRDYYDTARHAIGRLEDVGIDVFVDKVAETNRCHKIAHRMSRQAWNQVLVQKDWRPPDQPPDWKPVSSEDDSIPF